LDHPVAKDDSESERPGLKRRTTVRRSTATASRQWLHVDHADVLGPWVEETRPCWRRPNADRRCCRRTARPLSKACTPRPKNRTNLRT